MRLAKAREENSWEAVFNHSAQDVYSTVLRVLTQRDNSVAISNPESGLIQLAPISLTADGLRRLIPPDKASIDDTSTGRLIMSFRVLASREQVTRLQIRSVLIIDGPQAVIFGGIAVTSSGMLEQEYLNAIRLALQ